VEELTPRSQPKRAPTKPWW